MQAFLYLQWISRSGIGESIFLTQAIVSCVCVLHTNSLHKVSWVSPMGSGSIEQKRDDCVYEYTLNTYTME